jgi:aryl-alcohol dehydrogenase-like predicted oxidoreductase
LSRSAEANAATSSSVPASCTPPINLLHRKIESDGILDAARRLGVSLLAYSAQRQGILTGKYHADRSLIQGVHPLRRKVMGLTHEGLDRWAPLIDAMRDIAGEHRVTVGQVALAWLIGYYGDTVIPIAGASKPHHAEEAAGALKVHLPADELERLAHLSKQVTG